MHGFGVDLHAKKSQWDGIEIVARKELEQILESPNVEAAERCVGALEAVPRGALDYDGQSVGVDGGIARREPEIHIVLGAVVGMK